MAGGVLGSIDSILKYLGSSLLRMHVALPQRSREAFGGPGKEDCSLLRAKSPLPSKLGEVYCRDLNDHQNCGLMFLM